MPEKHGLPEEGVAQNSSSGVEITQDSPPEEEIRVGVYTCHCGGNISDVVNCPAVADVLGKINNVVVSCTDMSMCSDAGQSLIEKDPSQPVYLQTVQGVGYTLIPQEPQIPLSSKSPSNSHSTTVGMRMEDDHIDWDHQVC
jgi:hypothetical protein